MAPRANFSCHNCGKLGEHPGDLVIEDLPVASTRCPVCGFKRGFRRLFDAVNVSTTGHRIARVLDPMMEPQLNNAAMAKDDAKRSERQLAEDHARAIEILPEPQRPAMREALEGGPSKWVPAKMAAGGISPQAAYDSRHHIWPHVRRRIVPTRA